MFERCQCLARVARINLMSGALLCGPALAQVDVTLTTAFDVHLDGNAAFGGESMTAGGFSRDGDDYLLVTRAFDLGSDCPAPDPVVIYRRDTDLDEAWTIEASLDPFGDGTRPSVMALDGDTLVVGDPPGFSPHEGRALVYRRTAGAWDLEAELRASDPDFWDLYGSSVDVHEDTIAVGAYNEGSGANATSFQSGPGAVYIYTRTGTTWTQTAKLTASDGEDGDEFGYDVSVMHTWLGPGVLVGAPNDFIDDNPLSWGSAYFFENAQDGGWREVERVTHPPIGGANRFGRDVALESGIAAIASSRAVFAYDRDPAADEEQLDFDLAIEPDANRSVPSVVVDRQAILIGLAHDDTTRHAESGFVDLWHLTTFVGWNQRPVLSSDHFQTGDRMGENIFMCDGIIVAGAPGNDVAGVDAGAVHTLVYEANGLSEGHRHESTVLAAPAAPGGRFGTAIATDGERVIVGMPEAEPCVGQGGGAFIYKWQSGAWLREANLSLANLTADARFGAAVAIDGNRAIVGAPDDGNAAQGSVHVFLLVDGDWLHEQSITLDQPRPGDAFGAAVALRAGSAIAGAPGGGRAALLAMTPAGWEVAQALSGGAALTEPAEFGAAVALTSAGALIGAPGFDGERGAVCSVTPDGSIEDTLTGDGPAHRFGQAIDTTDDHHFIGSPGAGAGRVDVYTSQGASWALDTTLTPGAQGDGYAFGAAIAVDGNIAVVGAHDGGRGVFYAYYNIDAMWTEFTAMGHPEGLSDTGFASSLALTNERLLAGAPQQDLIEDDEGAVHPLILDFRFTVPPCPGDFTPDEIAAMHPGWLKDGDYFGFSVDADADAAVVGAPYADLALPDQTLINVGSASVYRRTGLYDWTVEQVVIDPGDTQFAASDTWGFDVAIESDYLLICAPGAAGNATGDGAAYMFRFDGNEWIQVGKLTATPGPMISGFGTSGDMDGGRIVIGSSVATSPSGVPSGTVWVFEPVGRDAWQAVAELESDMPAFADKFGAAVAISGDWIAVGAPARDDLGNGSGAVYVFCRASGAWTLHDTLLAPDGDTLDRLGTSVAIDGDVIVAGAPYADSGSPQSGAAYAFRYDPQADDWAFEGKLNSAFDAPSDLLGHSVAIDGSTIACGATFATHPQSMVRTGGVRLFSFDASSGTWVERDSAFPIVGNDADRLGTSVALNGGNLWAGAIGVDMDPASPPSPFIESGQATTFDFNCASPAPAVMSLAEFLDDFTTGNLRADIAAPFGVVDSADLNQFLRRQQ